jgi:hypothetical protein
VKRKIKNHFLKRELVGGENRQEIFISASELLVMSQTG